jgi:hypothetical protein
MTADPYHGDFFIGQPEILLRTMPGGARRRPTVDPAGRGD